MTKITNDKLFSGDFLEPQKKQMRDLIELTVKLQAEFKQLLESQKATLKGGDTKSTQGLMKRKQALDLVFQTSKDMQRLEEQNIKTRAQLANATSQESKSLTALRLEKQRVNKANKEEAIQNSKTSTSYERQNSVLRLSIKRYQDLAFAGKENTKEGKALLKTITRLDTKFKKVDATVGRSQRNVGNYARAWSGLRGALRRTAVALGITGGIIGLSRAIRGAVRLISDFQQGSANLASVLGKSRSEIQGLTKDAQRLGASTVFTAREVTTLQIAFAKLGFKEDEIKNATEATLELAAATGTDLGRAAEVAASTINGFGLDAQDTQRIVDVMAKSFSTSSLDMEKFSTAMASVGATAKNAGVSVERTTALLGTITDAGIDASTAGTALRNIFLELSKQGLTFEEAMEQIRTATDKNKKSFELFGKRGATVASVLADNTKKTKELEAGLNDAGGAAQKMADEQLDTLSGQTKLLSSAWEGFVLSLEDGDGVISTVLRGAIGLATEFLTTLTNLSKTQSIIDKERRQGVADESKSLAEQNIIRKQIVGFQQTSTEDLQKIVKEGKEGARIAQQTLDLRAQEGGTLEDQLKISQESLKIVRAERRVLAEGAAKRVKEINGIIKAERDADKGVANGVAILFNLKKKSNKQVNVQAEKQALIDKNAQKVGEILALQEFRNAQLRKASEEELLKITQLQGRSNSELVDLANAELQRREDIGEVQEDNNEKIKESTKRQERVLTGLAKLKDELKDVNKLRSDELVAEGETERFEALTSQSDELRVQIALYEKLLKRQDVSVQFEIDKEQAMQNVSALGEEIEKELEKQLEIAEESPIDVNVDKLEALINESFDKRKEGLIKERDFLLQNDELTAKERELIMLQFAGKIDDIERERVQTIDEVNDEIIEAQIKSAEELADISQENAKKIADDEKKVLNDRIKALQEFGQAWADLEAKRIDKQIDEIDRELTESQKREEQLSALAVAGNQTATDSISAEIKKQEELQRRKDALEKKKARQQAIVDSLGLLEQKIENDEVDPVTSTITDMAKLFSVIATTIPGFYKGTKGTVKDALGGPQLSGRDGYIVRVDGSEKVLNPELSKKTGSMTTDEIVDRAVMHKMGVHDDHQFIEPIIREIHQPFQTPQAMLHKLDSIERAINNKEVYLGGEFINNYEYWQERIKKGNKTIKNIHKTDSING